MGNSCCNNAEKDAHNKDYSGKPQKKQEGEELDPELLKHAADNEGKVVKIQANARGYLERKKMKEEKGEVYDKNKPKVSSRTSQRNKDGGPGTAVAKPVAKLPDYSNPATKATEEKLGAFNYDRDAPPLSEYQGLELITR